jgi:hypothetical protein
MKALTQKTLTARIKSMTWPLTKRPQFQESPSAVADNVGRMEILIEALIVQIADGKLLKIFPALTVHPCATSSPLAVCHFYHLATTTFTHIMPPP